MIPHVGILQSFKFNLVTPSDQKSWEKLYAVVYWLSHFGVSLVLKCVLSYKCQIKKPTSHIKNYANILH